jgi:dTDP-L-rhamnose 4-epimerase
VLVTGGAGFIGSHLVDELVARGCTVRVLDNLDPQVHQDRGGEPPEYVRRHVEAGAVEFLLGDVRDVATAAKAVEEVDAVFHLAAAVGVGQSMTNPRHYVDVNCHGTAVLLEAMLDAPRPPQKLVIASSMSVYGEGKYECPAHGEVHPAPRPLEQLERCEWEMRCPICGSVVAPLPTDEAKPLRPQSVYAVTKRDQEELALSLGQARGMPTIALRFFNAYGPRQSLGNPYTGVAAIFTTRLLKNHPPLVFEDGRQQRDLIHVSDVARALICAWEAPDQRAGVLNVGSGLPMNLLDLVGHLRSALGGPEPKVTLAFRSGDIRHCFADTRQARELLRFEARIPFAKGVGALIAWASRQNPTDRVEVAYRELLDGGLLIGGSGSRGRD